MWNKVILSAIILLFASFSKVAGADDVVPKLQVNPSGRVLIDGALYASPEKHLFKDGMAIPEARLGVKMKYGNWSSWIDVGFAYSKIGLRNMWIQYDFNERNALRAGTFIQPYGLQSTTTTSVKCTFETPMAANPFTPGIQLGIMFTHVAPQFLSQSSFHVESSALSHVLNYPEFSQQGYTLLSRFVWRGGNGRFTRGEPLYQIGLSGGFSTPQRRLEDDKDIHDGFLLASMFPTRVTTRDAVEAIVPNSMNSFKFTPEIVLAYNRFALEGQYFFQQINRRLHLPEYSAQSGYITLRGLLTRGTYGYDKMLGQVEYPKKNTLECVLNYSYTHLSDKGAGIYGGIANCLSATINYYFNPYITGRINYFYGHSFASSSIPRMTVNGFQIRLMVLF